MRRILVLVMGLVLLLSGNSCFKGDNIPKPKDKSNGVITGVIEIDGEEAAGVQIIVQDQEGNTVATATSDADGKIEIQVPVGSDYTVIVVADQQQGGATIEGVTVAAGQTVNIGVVAVNPALVTGVVSGTVSVGGEPVAGVIVSVVDSSGNTVSTGVTGEDGSFSLVVPVGEGYTVIIGGNAEQAGTTIPNVTVTENGTTDLGSVSVEPVVNTGIIAGAVVSGGAPVAGITVIVTDSSGNQVAVAVTDANGAYSISVPEGSGYTLTIVGNGSYEGTSQSGITVVAGETTQVGNTEVAPATGFISGTVLSGGNPVAGIVVIVVNGNGEEVATTTTDASGAYNLEVNAGSGYTVSIVGNSSFNGGSQSGITVVAGETSTVGTVNVTPVLRDGVLAGTLLAFADGTPVVGAQVNIFSAEGVQLGNAASGVDGSFSLTVKEGINLSLEVPAFSIYDRASKSGLRVYADQTTQVGVIYLTDNIVRADGAVQGVVVDAINGNRMSGVSVAVHVGGANGPVATLVDKNNAATSILASAVTSSVGFFKIGSENPLDNSLLDGQVYTVVIKKDGFSDAVVENLSVDGLTDIGTVSMVPALPNGQISVTLKWQPDNYPNGDYNGYTRDLDGHLVGPKKDGSLFHVYWADLTGGGSVDAWQDIDDTQYGSRNGETISMKLEPAVRAAGTYSYTVHNYSSCGGYYYGTCYNEYLNKESNAVVTVYDNYGMLAQVTIPENQTWVTNGWKVFDLVVAADMSLQVNVLNAARNISSYSSASGVRSAASFVTDPMAAFIASEIQGKTK